MADNFSRVCNHSYFEQALDLSVFLFWHSLLRRKIHFRQIFVRRDDSRREGVAFRRNARNVRCACLDVFKAVEAELAALSSARQKWTGKLSLFKQTRRVGAFQ